MARAAEHTQGKPKTTESRSVPGQVPTYRQVPGGHLGPVAPDVLQVQRGGEHLLRAEGRECRCPLAGRGTELAGAPVARGGGLWPWTGDQAGTPPPVTHAGAHRAEWDPGHNGIPVSGGNSHRPSGSPHGGERRSPRPLCLLPSNLPARAPGPRQPGTYPHTPATCWGGGPGRPLSLLQGLLLPQPRGVPGRPAPLRATLVVRVGASAASGGEPQAGALGPHWTPRLRGTEHRGEGTPRLPRASPRRPGRTGTPARTRRRSWRSWRSRRSRAGPRRSPSGWPAGRCHRSARRRPQASVRSVPWRHRPQAADPARELTACPQQETPTLRSPQPAATALGLLGSQVGRQRPRPPNSPARALAAPSIRRGHEGAEKTDPVRKPRS